MPWGSAASSTGAKEARSRRAWSSGWRLLERKAESSKAKSGLEMAISELSCLWDRTTERWRASFSLNRVARVVISLPIAAREFGGEASSWRCWRAAVM